MTRGRSGGRVPLGRRPRRRVKRERERTGELLLLLLLHSMYEYYVVKEASNKQSERQGPRKAQGEGERRG